VDRRTLYLDVAFRLFAEHGYNGVSMDRLVAEAGGSKATLYRYFSSKEQLFEAIIDDLTTSNAPTEATSELLDTPLIDGLRLIGHATAAAALSQRAVVLLRLALGEFGRFPQLAAALFERGPAVSYGRLHDFIAAKRAAGDVQVSDIYIAAEQFLGGIVGHQQLRMALGVSTPSAREISDRVESAISAFVAMHGHGSPSRWTAAVSEPRSV